MEVHFVEVNSQYCASFNFLFFLSRAVTSRASEPVFVLVLSTRTAVIQFSLLNSSKIAVTSSAGTTSVAPLLGLIQWVKYLHSVSISDGPFVFFCFFRRFSFVIILYCKVPLLTLQLAQMHLIFSWF